MTFRGPLRASFYLSFLDDASMSSPEEGSRLRVIGSGGYPHDVRVGKEQRAFLRAGRCFAPVVPAQHSLKLQLANPCAGELKILCANCFAEIWSHPLAPSASSAEVMALQERYWSGAGEHACPRCHALAAPPH